jgi:protein-disulfide isomerase
MENNPTPAPTIQEEARRASPDLRRLTSALYVLAGTVIVGSVIIAGTFVYTQRLALNVARETAQRMAANAGHEAAQQLGFNTGREAANPQDAAAGQNPQTQPSQPLQPINVSAVTTNGEPYIGEAGAPVTIVEWSDYQCPYCQQFELTIMPMLNSRYVQTGKVKIVFKDFQFLGPDSVTAGEVARAVWQAYPNDFYQWRQTVFQNQGEENHNADPNGLAMYLNVTAKVPGIDTNKIAQLVAQNKLQYDGAIKAGQTESSNFGVDGTPSFVIGNGNPPIIGGAPLQQFSKLIDAQKK